MIATVSYGQDLKRFTGKDSTEIANVVDKQTKLDVLFFNTRIGGNFWNVDKAIRNIADNYDNYSTVSEAHTTAEQNGYDLILSSEKIFTTSQVDTVKVPVTVTYNGRFNVTQRLFFEKDVRAGTYPIFKNNIDSVRFLPGSVTFINSMWFYNGVYESAYQAAVKSAVGDNIVVIPPGFPADTIFTYPDSVLIMDLRNQIRYNRFITDSLKLVGSPNIGDVITATDTLGNAVWETPNWSEIIPAVEMNPGSTPAIRDTINNIFNWEFSTGSDKEIYGSFIFKKSIFRGWTAIKVDTIVIHYISSASTGNFRLNFRHHVVGTNVAPASSPATMTYSDTVTALPPQVINGKNSVSIPLTNDGIKRGNLLQFYLQRLDSDALDTSLGSLHLTGIELHISPGDTAYLQGAILYLEPDQFAGNVVEGNNAANDTVIVYNVGDQTLNWTATENASWFSLSSTSGTLSPAFSEQVRIIYNTSSLAIGAHTDSIFFSSNTNNDTAIVSITVDPAQDFLTVSTGIEITLPPSTPPPSAAGDVVVKTASKKHKVTGFGAYIKWFNQSWWNNYSQSDKDSLFNLLYDHSGFTFLRIPFPAAAEPVNDNSDPYNLDLTKFRPFAIYSEGGYEYHEATIDSYAVMTLVNKDAGTDTLKWLISTWSPAPWLKTGNTAIGSNLLSDKYEEYAEQAAGVISVLQDTFGVNVTYISEFNEPTISAGYPSSPVWGQQFKDIMLVFRPIIVDTFGVNVKIAVPEQNVINSAYHDSFAPVSYLPYYDAFIWHGYNSNGYFNWTITESYYTDMKQRLVDRSNITGMQTEISNFPPTGGDASQADTYEEGLHTLKFFYYDVDVAGAGSWIWWIAYDSADSLDGSGSDQGRAAAQRLIHMDETAASGQAVKPSPKFYAFTMVTKHVPENSWVVDDSVYSSDLLVTSFLTRDDKGAALVINKGTSSMTFDLEFRSHTATQITQYEYTSSSYAATGGVNGGTINASSGVFTVTVPAQSAKMFVTNNGASQ